MQKRIILRKIALGLKTVGLINIQFAIKDDMVYIIEAKPESISYSSVYC
jgi:hypothetical protein